MTRTVNGTGHYTELHNGCFSGKRNHASAAAAAGPPARFPLPDESVPLYKVSVILGGRSRPLDSNLARAEFPLLGPLRSSLPQRRLSRRPKQPGSSPLPYPPWV